MPGCVFHVTGEELDVDKFLVSSTLLPYRTHHRGEPCRRAGTFNNSGFSLDVSGADGLLADEVRDAIRFLVVNELELRRLQNFPGVTDMRLDFGYDRRDVVVQCDYLPSELLLRAGSLNIGIELSLYPQLEPEDR